jgi:hypothetical protein
LVAVRDGVLGELVVAAIVVVASWDVRAGSDSVQDTTLRARRTNENVDHKLGWFDKERKGNLLKATKRARERLSLPSVLSVSHVPDNRLGSGGLLGVLDLDDACEEGLALTDEDARLSLVLMATGSLSSSVTPSLKLAVDDCLERASADTAVSCVGCESASTSMSSSVAVTPWEAFAVAVAVAVAIVVLSWEMVPSVEETTLKSEPSFDKGRNNPRFLPHVNKRAPWKVPSVLPWKASEGSSQCKRRRGLGWHIWRILDEQADLENFRWSDEWRVICEKRNHGTVSKRSNPTKQN